MGSHTCVGAQFLHFIQAALGFALQRGGRRLQRMQRAGPVVQRAGRQVRRAAQIRTTTGLLVLVQLGAQLAAVELVVVVGVAVDSVRLAALQSVVGRHHQVRGQGALALHLDGAAALDLELVAVDQDPGHLLAHLDSAQHPARLETRGHVHRVAPDVVRGLGCAFACPHVSFEPVQWRC